MKKLACILALFSAIGFAHAESHEHPMRQDVPTHGTQATHQGTGVVKAINEQSGKVQIAHEHIPSLEWPAMTMWFKFSAPLSAEIHAGDSIRFELQQQGKEWVITGIEHGK